MLNYPESVEYLYSLGNELKSAKLSLEQVGIVWDAMGFPASQPPVIHVADSLPFKHRHGENPERPRPTSPERQGLAAGRASSPALQAAIAPPAQARAALPLSQALLAQRKLASRDDSQVVHVTIGRIEVVANTAAAPASRRSPAPRQATVTLADYLNGGHGSRP